jgi:hypothetical protein
MFEFMNAIRPLLPDVSPKKASEQPKPEEEPALPAPTDEDPSDPD